MKKSLIWTLFVLLMLFLVGCGDNQGTNGDKEGGDGDGKTVIRFACLTMYSGNEANENLYPMVLAVRKFEQEHPDIKVEIIRAPQVPNEDETGTVEQPWVEYLQTLAANNEFPDVFMAPNMPNVLLQGWCYDMSEQVAKDEDFNLMYEDLAASGSFFGHQFAIPFCYEFFGYFINKTLFDDNNMDYPTFDVTVDEMIQISKDMTRLVEGGNSVIGISGGGNMFNYMASQFDNNLGWFAWNANTNTFDLKSEAFRKAVEYSLAFYSAKDYSNDALTDDERIAYFGDPNWYNVWWSGREAIHFDYSSFLLQLINAKENGTFNYDFDFIGIPKGSEDSESLVPVKATYMMIGNNTKHPDEAYELLKALTYDPEYYAYKLEVSRTVDGIYPWTFAPLTKDEVASKAFFEDTFSGYPELKKVIENGNFYFDLWATQPGFEHARWNLEYKEGVSMDQILTQICSLGTEKLGDHVDEIQRLMNAYIAESYQTVKDKYGIKDEN